MKILYAQYFCNATINIQRKFNNAKCLHLRTTLSIFFLTFKEQQQQKQIQESG